MIQMPLGLMRKLLLFWFLTGVETPLSPALAEVLPAAEGAKIEALIKHIQNLRHAVFVRNGKEYGADTTARFLRKKWESKKDEIRSARDFIEKVASVSSTSGHPYHIRLKDGRTLTSREYLLVQLANLENE